MAPVQAERAVRRLTLHENRGKGGKKKRDQMVQRNQQESKY